MIGGEAPLFLSSSSSFCPPLHSFFDASGPGEHVPLEPASKNKNPMIYVVGQQISRFMLTGTPRPFLFHAIGNI